MPKRIRKHQKAPSEWYIVIHGDTNASVVAAGWLGKLLLARFRAARSGSCCMETEASLVARKKV